MEEEVRWEGAPWFYGVQMVACLVVVYGRSLVLPKVPVVEKLASSVAARSPLAFPAFQRVFLGVFYLASVVDALQGVYGEALYESYGLRRKEIASLFAIGYSSSLFLGTFVAASADYVGRKRACMLYGLVQVVGCLAKQYNDLYVLAFANICLGLAHSLLFSSFEAWMIAEHEKLGFRQEWLSESFWLMAFGSGIIATGLYVATGSGALGNFMFQGLGSSGSAPLIAAAASAALTVVIISISFNENTGTASSRPWSPLLHAIQTLHDRKVLLLGWAQVCFDFAVTIFWLLWIPTLVADGREVHSGSIYARLMACMMFGSTIAVSLINGPMYLRPESFLPVVFLVGGTSLCWPAYNHHEVWVLVCCFCVFHFSVGMAWPSLARLRCIYIPNDHRAAVMSLYRVPLYIAVLFIIIQGGSMQKLNNSTIFAAAALSLMSGAVSMFFLYRVHPGSKESFPVERP